MSEGLIQDQIRLFLGNDPRFLLFRNNVGRADIRGRWVAFGVGGPGGSDLIGCFNGRLVCIEIKTATGKQSPEQKLFQQLIERNGGIYAVLRSVDDAEQWARGLA